MSGNGGSFFSVWSKVMNLCLESQAEPRTLGFRCRFRKLMVTCISPGSRAPHGSPESFVCCNTVYYSFFDMEDSQLSAHS